MWLDILLVLISWLIGAGFFLLASWVIQWVMRKILRFEIKFSGGVILLVIISIIEPFVWHTGIDRTLTWDWQHVINSTLPSLVFAILLLWWIDRGDD